MTPRFAAAAGVAAVVAAIAVFSFASDRRIIDTNTIAPMVPARTLNPERPVCQRLKRVRAGAGFVRLRAERGTTVAGETEQSTIGGLRVELTDAAGRTSAGTVFRPREGLIEVPLRPPTRVATGGRLCVRNLATDSLLLFGEQKRPFEGATQAQRHVAIGITFLDEDPSTRFSRAGRILTRFGHGHAGAVGTWALWFAGVIVLLASMLALWQTVRDTSRE